MTPVARLIVAQLQTTLRRMHAPRRSRTRTGLTLVETALIVSLVGVLLAIAVPTFVRTVQTSKVAEASSMLETLYRESAVYYATERTPPAVSMIAKAEAATPPSPANHTPATTPAHVFCLPDPAGPAPAKPSPKAVSLDFQADTTPGVATWRALGFTTEEPIRFSYSYLPAIAGCRIPSPAPVPSLLLRAEGDLDGDGVYSEFERTARITTPGELVPDPVLHVVDRVE